MRRPRGRHDNSKEQKEVSEAGRRQGGRSSERCSWTEGMGDLGLEEGKTGYRELC